MKRWTRAGLVVIGAFLFSTVFKAGASAPVIAYPPGSETVILYDQAAFGVTADGSAPLSYQWLKNGVPMPGATNDQIVIQHAQFSDEAGYSVIVSNVDGNITSMNADLAIRLPRAGDVDGTFVTGGMIDNRVRAVVVQPDGKILIGGDFTTVHGAAHGGIARLNTDGSTDQTFLNGLAGVRGTVCSIARQSDGKIIIGGEFGEVNDVPCWDIARLNRDGSLDTTFGGAVSGTIYSLALQGDGKIIVGGSFWQTNDIAPKNLERLNPDGSLDDSFLVDSNQFPMAVEAVALQSDGKILVARYPYGAAIQPVVRLNSDGTMDNSFHNVALVPAGYPPVASLAVQSDGNIFIGGSFTNVDGFSCNNLARLHSDGTIDTNFIPAFPAPTSPSGYASVNSIAIQPDGKIVAGADFSRFYGNGGNDAYTLTRFNVDGTRDYSLGSSISGSIGAVALQSDGKVVIGGDFASIQGPGRAFVARFADNTVDAGFQNGFSGPDGHLFSIALEPGGTFLAGGIFDRVGDVARPCLARFNPDGTVADFAPEIFGYNEIIRSVAAASGGKVLLSGSFQFPTDHGFSRTLGLLNSDGTADASVQIIGGTSSGVSAFVVQSNLNVFAAQYSEDYYGQTSVRISRIPLAGNTQQGVWREPSLQTYANVSCMALQADGKLLIGGYFKLSNCVSVARFNPDGSLDDTFQCSVMDSNSIPADPGSVNAMAVQKDGKIIIAGFFPLVNGGDFPTVARLNPDGSVDSSFHCPIPYGQEVSAIALQDDGKIVVGSAWLERLNSDGSIDTSFQGYFPNAMVPDTSALAIQPDGKILVSPGMAAIHGIATGYLTRLWGKDFPPVLKNLVRTETNVCLTWHAISNHTYRVQYSEDFAGGNWQDLAGDVCATNDIAGKTDVSCGGAKQRFYRVVQLP